MNSFKDYDRNPILFLWDTKHEILPKYLWRIWSIIILLIFFGAIFDIIDLSVIDSALFIDLSITGLTFTIVIVSAALEVFKGKELVKLLKIENEKVNGLYFLELLTPYVFTALIFLLISLFSIIAPLVKINIPIYLANIFNYIYVSILLLSLFSLFNICYSILNHFYYSVRREAEEEKLDDKKKKS